MSRPNVLLTGYWPPTNEMLRGFAGGRLDWEGRGVDVHAHFPEFPPGCGPGTDAPWGVGEMEVDYAKTLADFARFLERYDPVAVVTFSRCRPGSHWKLEPACRRHRLPGEPSPEALPLYITDRREPGFPFEIATDPAGTVYPSTLPMESIAAEVERVTEGRIAGLIPPVDDAFDYGGAYLSGFAGYLGTRHAATSERCQMAGHIHVGRDVTINDATLAAEATVRVVTDALQPVDMDDPRALAASNRPAPRPPKAASPRDAGATS